MEGVEQMVIECMMEMETDSEPNLCVVCNRNYEFDTDGLHSSENCEAILKSCSKFLKPNIFSRTSLDSSNGSFCSDCLHHGEHLSILHNRLKELRKEIDQYARYFTKELQKYRADENPKSAYIGKCKVETDQTPIKNEVDWDNYENVGYNSADNFNFEEEPDSDDSNDKDGGISPSSPVQNYIRRKRERISEELSEEENEKSSELELKMNGDNELPWKCPACSKVCITARQRKDHKRTAHYKKYIDGTSPSSPVPSSIRRKLQRISEELSEEENEKSSELELKMDNKLPWKCAACSKVCTTARQRKDHKRTVHYRNYKESLLEESTSTSGEVSNHRNTLRPQRAAAAQAIEKLADLSSMISGNIKVENDSTNDGLSDDEQNSPLVHENKGEKPRISAAKKMSCRVCPRKFDSLFTLKSHMKAHTSWECTTCFKVFYTSRSKRDHVNKAHQFKQKEIPDSYTCDIETCKRVFSNEFDYEVHCLAHSDEVPFECAICHSKFSNIKNYLNHQKDSDCTTSGIAGAPDEYACDLCTGKFRARYLLLVHRKLHNRNSKKCEMCPKILPRRSDFTKHVLAHTDEAPFSCDICGKRFRAATGVGPHRVSHTGKEVFSCKHDNCTMKFGSAYSLARHFQSEHQEKVHVCDVCGKQYKIYGDFKSHVKSHSKNIPCEECGKTFYRLADLNRHKRKHTGDLFKCPSCPKAFLNNSNLKKHTEEAHLGKSFICEICGKALSSSLTHAVHVKSHGLKERGEKPFPCTHCDKKYYTKRELVEHNRLHTGERISCPICGEEFTRKLSLDYHVRTHTGEHSYKCDVCGKGVATKTTLTIHMRTHTGEKPFQCTVCSKNFSRKDHLKEHEKRHERDLAAGNS